MFQLSLLTLTIFGGVLVDPFPLADAISKHHQIMLSAAMASDGHFGVAWVDSAYDSSWRPDRSRLDLYVRFFAKDGNPLTDPYKLSKIADTCWTFFPSLDMDSAGNAVLVWIENQTRSSEILSNIRFQRFAKNGSPAASAKTLYSQVDIGFPTPISISNKGEFAMAFQTILDDSSGNWVQRFDLSGEPMDSPFLAHAPYESFPPDSNVSFRFPHTTLNDSGDVVVTWLDSRKSAHMYPMFQAFDADDESILPWEPGGHRVDDGADRTGACAPKPYWLDNDRFVVFWSDYCVPPFDVPIFGRVFEDRGITHHPITIAFEGDSLWGQGADPKGQFSTAVASDDRLAYTHTRVHTLDSGYVYFWAHAAGMLGEVKDNEPQPGTGLFEYTAPWGADTFKINPMTTPIPVQTPAVAATSDRLLWVYSRMTRVGQDSVFKAYAMITDWDMGVPVTPVTHPLSTDFELVSSIGSTVTLRYSNCPNGLRASVYDAGGRKVDELYAPTQSGALSWGSHQSPGVYFIVPQGISTKSVKAVIVR